ncbi:MAG: ACT domain-containing protein [Ruminococcaceae bacterium]|nr:ACT domain-containing protein [Oscillospiraceae bacterium]
MSKPKLYIVEASMLPEVFLKVSEAKEYLQTGAASTVAEAVAKADISRSAFYKYKDAITPFRDVKRDQVVTMSIITQDKPGALSSVLAIFASAGANILTINQSIPTNGVGIVTISIIAEEMTVSLDALRSQVEALPNVIRIEVLAG